MSDWKEDMRTEGMSRPEAPGKLIQDVMHFIKRFVSFSNDHQVVATSLWVLHTYVMDAAESTAYLQPHSPEKRSGKTRLLEVLELLVYLPWRLASPTGPVLFRRIAKSNVTLLLDEYDCIFKDKSGSYEDIRSILNSGHRRGSSVFRCIGEGTKMDVKEYPVFCAKALSGIGQPPDTIADRSIPIKLKRQGATDKVERFIRRRVEPDARPIRERLQVWADASLDSLTAARPHLPEELNDRAADGWEPLLAIADLIGGEWPAKGRDAAKALHVGADDDSVGVLLLVHIQAAFKNRDKLPTADLLKALIAEEKGPWGQWWGADVDSDKTKGPASKLARLLKPFGIEPQQIRTPDKVRGYEKAQFMDAWSRYLTPRTVPIGKKDGTVGTPQVESLKSSLSEESGIEQNKGSDQVCTVVPSENATETGQDEREQMPSLFVTSADIEVFHQESTQALDEYGDTHEIVEPTKEQTARILELTGLIRTAPDSRVPLQQFEQWQQEYIHLNTEALAGESIEA